MKPAAKQRNAFTRTELLVVIGIIVVLALLVIPVTRFVKERSIRSQCANNLRQSCQSLIKFANDHEGLLPDCTRKNPEFYGPLWPIEVHTNLVTELEVYGGGRRVFYCPANSQMNDDNHWNFADRYRSRVRVLGYVFLLNGTRQLPPNLWRTNLLGDGIRSPSKTELVVDITASQKGNYVEVRGINKDRTSHIKETRPIGGNMAFEDGHVDWRPFKKMEHRIFGDAIWDF